VTFKFHRLSKSGARRIAERAAALGIDQRVREAAVLEESELRLYWLDGFIVAESGDLLFPVLDESANRPILSALPSVILDMGAVARVAEGADVMGPGVVEVRGEFAEGGLVIARDERYGRAVALCRAIVPSCMLAPRRRGRVAENIHHPGDRVWRAAARLRGLLK